jgi:hypothetical protein
MHYPAIFFAVAITTCLINVMHARSHYEHGIRPMNAGGEWSYSSPAGTSELLRIHFPSNHTVILDNNEVPLPNTGFYYSLQTRKLGYNKRHAILRVAGTLVEDQSSVFRKSNILNSELKHRVKKVLNKGHHSKRKHNVGHVNILVTGTNSVTTDASINSEELIDKLILGSKVYSSQKTKRKE